MLTASAGTGLVGLDVEHNNQRAPMWSDLGDTMIRERSTEPPFNGRDHSHNFTSRIGFGFRF